MKKSFVISQQYLLLPIKAQEETRQVAFYCEGKKILEFAVPVSDCGAAGDKAGKQAYAFNYYAPIPMRHQMAEYELGACGKPGSAPLGAKGDGSSAG